MHNSQSILDTHRRRLQKLELQAARQGSSTDPAILNEIEDIKALIQQIEQASVGNAGPASRSAVPAPAAASQPSRNPNKVNPAIIVAIIGLISTVLVALISRGVLPWPGADTNDVPFSYEVRVQSASTGNNIADAQVTIEIGAIAPLDEYTDASGLARLQIDATRVGQPGRLLIEATGYQSVMLSIDLRRDQLPNIVRLTPRP